MVYVFILLSIYRRKRIYCSGGDSVLKQLASKDARSLVEKYNDIRIE